MTATEPQPGWLAPTWAADMSAWVDARLRASGTHRRGAMSEVRVWARAGLLTFETDRGRMWAKAVPPIFGHEIALTELLADIDPGIVPPVVAADRDLGRIVTEHVEGPVLSEAGGDPAVWAAALSRLAEIQRVLASDPAALAAAGAARAPVADLAADLSRLLDDGDLLFIDRPGGLTGAEATALRARIPEFVAACQALAESGIPDSLDHGDLAADEVIIGAMGPVFLDWSDGSITHPFLSAASLLADGGGAGGSARALAYLEPWRSAGLDLSERAGLELLAMARIVLPLHRAALYARRILPALADPAELAATVPAALRTILPG